MPAFGRSQNLNIASQVTRGQTGYLGKVFVPDIVLSHLGRNAFEVADIGAALAGLARLAGAVTDGQRDDVAFTGSVGVATAIEMRFEDRGAHRKVEMPRTTERRARPASRVRCGELAPALLQSRATADEFAVDLCTLRRIVEGPDDLVALAAVTLRPLLRPRSRP